MTRRLPAGLLALLLTVPSLLLLAAPPAADAARGNVRYEICHRTNSLTNPYRRISVAWAALSAHGSHSGPVFDVVDPVGSHRDPLRKWGDVFFATRGSGNGNTKQLNWDAAGRAIFGADGAVPATFEVDGVPRQACRGLGTLEFITSESEAGVPLRDIMVDLDDQAAADDVALKTALGGGFTSWFDDPTTPKTLTGLTAALAERSPSATTDPVTDVTETGAILHGTARPQGAPTAVAFEWGTHPSLAGAAILTEGVLLDGTPGTTTSATVPVAVRAPLTGLTSGTTYYYRLVGSVSVGTGDAATDQDVLGAIRAFTPGVDEPTAEEPDGEVPGGEEPGGEEPGGDGPGEEVPGEDGPGEDGPGEDPGEVPPVMPPPVTPLPPVAPPPVSPLPPTGPPPVTPLPPTDTWNPLPDPVVPAPVRPGPATSPTASPPRGQVVAPVVTPVASSPVRSIPRPTTTSGPASPVRAVPVPATTDRVAPVGSGSTSAARRPSGTPTVSRDRGTAQSSRTGPPLASGRGADTADGATTAERSLRELAREPLAGFGRGSSVTVDVAGTRTTGQFILSTSDAVDVVAIAAAIRDSVPRYATDFAHLDRVRPWTGNGAPSAPSLRSTAVERRDAFADVGLAAPSTLADQPRTEDGRWLELRATVATYRPGSTVYLAVTSDPLVLAEAKVDRDGEATLSGFLPLDVLGAGGHRLRVVGTRVLDGVTAGDDGQVHLAPETLEEIGRFDRGTHATVVVSGTAADGGEHTAIRIVPLDDVVPWWTVWLAAFIAAAGASARRRGWLRGRGRGMVATAAVLAGGLPAFVLGWLASAWLIMGLGSLIAVVGAVASWVVPVRGAADGAASVPAEPALVDA